MSPPPPGPAEPHLPAELVAAFLDAAVTRAERDLIVRHLVACDFCLGEVIAALEVLRSGALGPDDGAVPPAWPASD